MQDDQNKTNQTPSPIKPEPTPGSAPTVTTPPPIPAVAGVTDIPPPPPIVEATQEQKTDAPTPTSTEATDSTPPAGGPPIMVTSGGKPKSRGGKKKIIATILGLLFLVGSVGAGVILVQRNQDIAERASVSCIDSVHCPNTLYDAEVVNGVCACVRNDKDAAPPGPPPPPGPAGSCTEGYTGTTGECEIDPMTGEGKLCRTYRFDTCATEVRCDGGTCSGNSSDFCDAQNPCSGGLFCTNGRCSTTGEGDTGGTGGQGGDCENNSECGDDGFRFRCVGGQCVDVRFCDSNGCDTNGYPGCYVNHYTSDDRNDPTVNDNVVSEGGQSASLGATNCGAEQIDVTCDGAGYTDSVSRRYGSDCDGSTTPPPPPPPGLTAQCLEVKAFDTDFARLTLTDLALLNPGDSVIFTVAGNASAGTFTGARFTINGTTRPVVTAKRPGTDEFMDTFVIPEGTTSFGVKGEIRHSELGFF